MASSPQPGRPAHAKDLRFEQRLGRGFFGEVWRATTVETGETFAVKKVGLSLVSQNNLSDQLQREIKILYSLRHPRIVTLHFDFDDGTYMYLGMEYASGGSLFDRLSAVTMLPAAEAARYFLQVCEALDYLHHLPEKVIHRDIKPENILLDSKGDAKLADFGWANLLDRASGRGRRDTFCGTLDYLSPEMIMGTGHDESVDMWSMGVLLYELITGRSPFGSTSNEATCRLILDVDLRFPEDVDPDVKDLVVRLCTKKRDERLSVTDAMTHRFITKTLGEPMPATASDALAAAPEEPPAEAGAGDPGMGRPSVAVRGLQVMREKNNVEISLVAKATKATEDLLLQAQAELARTRAAVCEEQGKRAAVEAQHGELEAASKAREKELEELRRRSESLEAEVAKLKRRDAREERRAAWWGRGESTQLLETATAVGGS